MTGSPCGDDDETVITSWPRSFTNEVVQIELQTIFKAYSLSRSCHPSHSPGALIFNLRRSPIPARQCSRSRDKPTKLNCFSFYAEQTSGGTIFVFEC